MKKYVKENIVDSKFDSSSENLRCSIGGLSHVNNNIKQILVKLAKYILEYCDNIQTVNRILQVLYNKDAYHEKMQFEFLEALNDRTESISNELMNLYINLEDKTDDESVTNLYSNEMKKIVSNNSYVDKLV